MGTVPQHERRVRGDAKFVAVVIYRSERLPAPERGRAAPLYLRCSCLDRRLPSTVRGECRGKGEDREILGAIGMPGAPEPRPPITTSPR